MFRAAADFIVLINYMTLTSLIHYAMVYPPLENYIVPSPPRVKLWLHCKIIQTT
jgi:hypothetical protein